MLDQDRHSHIDALAKCMLIGVETSQEGDTLEREYIVNPWERPLAEGDLSGGRLGAQPISEPSMHGFVYSS